MNRLSHNLSLITIVCGLSIVSLTSCNANKNGTDDVIITVNDPGEKIFPFNDFFRLEKRVYVSAEGEYFLSDIHDIHVTEKYAFILDYSQSISKIDLESGEIVSQLHQQGRGPQDYLYPLGICGDDKYLYLLDAGSNVHIYDFDLKHQDKISLDGIPSPASFCKIKEGYVFLNSFENDSIGKFIITDGRCRLKDSYLKTPREDSPRGVASATMYFTQKFFIPDSYGKVLCHNSKDDAVYLYDGKNLVKKCQFKLDEDLLGTPGVYIKQIFSPNGNILVNYFSNGKGDYAYYDKNCNLIAQGIGGGEVPFFPICQIGNKLVTAFTTDDEVGAELPGKSIQAQIIIHCAK